ncbi:MAG: calcium-binding protein [Pseudomonadota bacterium]
MPVFTGTTGSDFLVDTQGDDSLNGLGGFDVLSVQRGIDTVDGGDDSDFLIVNYGGQNSAVTNQGIGSFRTADGLNSVTFTNIESINLTTGSGDDVVRTFYRPDPNADVIVSGNDLINLGQGNDFVGAGGGNDTIYGGDGNDRIDGDGAIRGKFGAGRNLGDQEFSGDDLIYGEGGDDLLVGGNGNDYLDGGIGDDTLYGDGVIFSYGDTSLSGGGDTVSQVDRFGGEASGNDTLIGGDGNDTLEGRLGNDILSGGNGADLARFNISRDGLDRTDLGADQDTVEVSVNADSERSNEIRVTFTSAEVGNGSSLDGGMLANQDGDLAVRMQSEGYSDNLVGGVSRFDDEGVTFVAQGDATFDVRDLVSGTQRGNTFRTLTLGSSAADTNFGTSMNDYINAGGGDDVISGGDGADFLVGGAGNDTLNGGNGADTILGGAGNDTIDTVDRAASGGAAVAATSDTVDAGAGDDRVTAGRLDVVNGGDGDDFLEIDFSVDGANANPAAVSLTLDTTGAGVASDGTTISNFERIALTLTGNGDVVSTGNVAARLDGGAGNDILTTGLGNDQLSGGAGDDVLSAGAGNDTLSGGTGNDTITGGAGDDSASFDLSRDGADRTDLGDGSDTVVFAGTPGNYRVTFTSAEVGNGSANDSGSMTNQDGGLAVRVQLEDANGVPTGDISRFDDEGIQFLGGTPGITFDVRDLVSGAQRGETFEGVVLGTNGDDALSFNSPLRQTQSFYYNAGAGNDTVTGGSANDFLVGGTGNDVLLGGAGNDTFLGGSGNDVFEVTEAGDTVVENAAGGEDAVFSYLNSYTLAANVETLALAGSAVVGVGNALDNTLIGTTGNNVLIGGAGADVLIGGLGNDTYEVTETRDAVREEAGGGTDAVFSYLDAYLLADNVETLVLAGVARVGLGNAGVNSLFGNSGNNILNGNGGNDFLTGGAGQDQYWHLAGDGNDTVADFSAGETIVLSQSQFSNFNEVRNAMTQVDGNVVITSGSQTLTLNNVTISQLGAGNFAYYSAPVAASMIEPGKGLSTFTSPDDFFDLGGDFPGNMQQPDLDGGTFDLIASSSAQSWTETPQWMLDSSFDHSQGLTDQALVSHHDWY